MSKLRTLWKVTQGIVLDGRKVNFHDVWRPESKVKAYDIYVENNARGGICDYTDVWCDERLRSGWELYEHIDHSKAKAGSP